MKSLQFKHESNQIINQRYRIIDILGEGGIGITYQAEDLETKEKVALKVVSLKQHKNWKTIELFEREAEVLQKLNHLGIPKYLDYFEIETEQDKIFYIAQQLALGKSLDKWVKEGWRTTEKEIKQIAAQILDILQYLQELTPPIIHRDIKPQNLIRNSEGEISLVDFGAVQNTYYNTCFSGSTVVGTYGYMAPEHFRALPATDLYSLGATILYLLTHRSPSELPRDSYDNLKIDFRSSVNISEGFAHWLETMLEPAIENRFSSAKEALNALKNPYSQGILVKRKTQLLIALGIILGVTGIAIASFLHYENKNIEVITEKLICQLDPFESQFALGWERSGYYPGIKNSELTPTKLSIMRGADVNAVSPSGYTPLIIIAAGPGDYRKYTLEIGELLIKKGANVNVQSKDGLTPLIATIRDFHKKDGVPYRYEDPNKIEVESERRYQMAKLLIEKGANVNTPNKNGLTPLIAANIADNQKIAKLLIEKGADINAGNKNAPIPNVPKIEIIRKPPGFIFNAEIIKRMNNNSSFWWTIKETIKKPIYCELNY